MARKTKDDKAKAASAKGRSTSGAKGAKVKRAKPVRKAMVIKEKKVASSRKTPIRQLADPKSPVDSAPKPRHGRRYLEAKAKVDPAKLYPPEEAVRLVKETNLARFAAKVDLHLNLKDAKFKKEISLPHPFELHPEQSRRAKAPNKKPEAQKRETDQDAKSSKLLLKSEKKTPLLHTSIGTVKDQDEDLLANLKAVLAAFGHGMVLKATLTSSMGPGIKVQTG